MDNINLNYTHKKIPILDYGARLMDNRSTCVIMDEISSKYKSNMNNPKNFRDFMNKNGKQLSIDNFMKVINDQQQKR